MRIVARLGLGLVVFLALAAGLLAWVLRDAFSDLPDVAALRAYRP